MANCYDQYTVAPLIPRGLLTPLHEAALAACGFTCATWGEDPPMVFIYNDTGLVDFDPDEFNYFANAQEEADQRVLDDADQSPFANKVRAALALSEEKPQPAFWTEVFLDLARSAPNELPEITIVGGFHSDRMEPNCVGGAAHRFSAADGWQWNSTDALIDRLRLQARRVNQLAEVLDLAHAKAAELEAAGTPIDVIAQVALSETRDHVVNHPLLNQDRRPDPAPRAYARVEWEPGDLLDLRPNWSRAEASDWLAANAGEIKRRVTEIGLTIIEAILARDDASSGQATQEAADAAKD